MRTYVLVAQYFMGCGDAATLMTSDGTRKIIGSAPASQAACLRACRALLANPAAFGE